MKTHRTLTTKDRKIVLDRDGWCCNKCGYVPYHTLNDVPTFAKKTYDMFWSYIRSLRTPIIFTKYDILPDTPDEILGVDVNYFHGGELEFDHIIPVYKGGSLELNNVQALCHDCHNSKSNTDYRKRRVSTVVTI